MTRRTSAALGVAAIMALGTLTACASGTGHTLAAGSSASPSATTAPVSPTAPATVTPSPGGSTPHAGLTPPAAEPSSGTPRPGTVKPVGYSAAGTVLTVDFYAGVCQKFGLVADQATAGEVRVTIVVTGGPRPGQLCPALIRQQAVSADLGSPLDGRTVVDATTGRIIPQQNVIPGGGMMTHGPTRPN
ncbi:hypothetical protein [Streptacidiphilus sp. EB129]|uniref:hypothetical protein n=1 Tax=Streptacidiphilus sp. EB129 TaxID=3156262 RepID=UPI003510FCD1